MIGPNEVAVVRADAAEYPVEPPFSPYLALPEYGMADLAPEPNHAYLAVRNVLAAAGLDAARFGGEDWNPLADVIRPGETVVLKPNLVKESHPRDPAGWAYVMTHGAVIRAVADYVFAAVGPTGRVVVADAPQTDSSFAAIVAVLGLGRLRQFYADRGLTLDLLDLRQEEWISERGVIVERRPLPGDPAGVAAYDLAGLSEFVGHGGGGRYYGADYDSGVVNEHHTGGRHEYLLSGTVMDADVIVSLPKLKTHKKAGVTVSLKNLVGVNADKNWLPHHTDGPPADGGDEHPQPDLRHQVERWGAGLLRRAAVRSPKIGAAALKAARRGGTPVFGDSESVIRSGNWYGNDTVWRMALDLNKIVAYGRPDGTLAEAGTVRRRHLVLVDGIVAGQGSGPMNPDPLPAGLVLFGMSPPSVDAAATYLLGFDPGRVPIVRQAFRCGALPLAEWPWTEVALVCPQVADWNGPLPALPPDSTLHAEPHFAWRDHVELGGLPADAIL